MPLESWGGSGWRLRKTRADCSASCATFGIGSDKEGSLVPKGVDVGYLFALFVSSSETALGLWRQNVAGYLRFRFLLGRQTRECLKKTVIPYSKVIDCRMHK